MVNRELLTIGSLTLAASATHPVPFTRQTTIPIPTRSTSVLLTTSEGVVTLTADKDVGTLDRAECMLRPLDGCLGPSKRETAVFADDLNEGWSGSNAGVEATSRAEARR